MRLFTEILATLPDGPVENIVIGSNWTGVSLFVDDQRCCGLASTLRDEKAAWQGQVAAITGKPIDLSAIALASIITSPQTTLSSAAAAAMNGLLQYSIVTGSSAWDGRFGITEQNAEELILHHGRDRRVAVVGHFPFTERVKAVAAHLDVLELNPAKGDLPASAAIEVIPQADLVAITGMSFINRTLEDLLKLCSPLALVLVLGASTPLSPVLFDYGVDYICSAIVKEIDPVLQAVAHGAVYPQVVQAGLRLVTLHKRNKFLGK